MKVFLFPLLFLGLALLAGIDTSKSAPEPHDIAERVALFQAIQERAGRDVKLGNAPADIEKLKLLFGDKAQSAEISLLELLTTYEDAYRKAKPAPTWWEPNAGWG